MAQEAHDPTGDRQSRRPGSRIWLPRRSLIGAVAVMAGVLAANHLDRGNPEDMRKIPGAAKAFSAWTQQREYPFRDIPDAASYRAFEYSKQHLKSRQKSLTSSPWVPIGPHNLGGRTLAVAISPDDGDVVYAGSASGGLWKSTTGGIGAAAWQQMPTGFPVLAVSSIALVAGDPDTIYIGSGEVYNYQNAEIFGEAYRSMRGSYGIGILKTSDGGATWTKSLDWSANQRRGVQAVKIDPSDPTIVWAATTEGVYQSSDGGISWSLVLDVVMATDLVIDPTDGDAVVAACGNFASVGKGLYRTTNGGDDWTVVWDGQNPDFIGKIQLAGSPSSPNILFASIGSGFDGTPPEFTLLAKSIDGGLTWTTASQENYATYQGWYSHDVAVNPSDPNEVITVGFYVWRSNQAGANLVQRSVWDWYGGQIPPGDPEGPPEYVHPDIHDVVYHPTNHDIVYFGTDGGVFRTTDGGDAFEGCNGGYQTTQFYNGFSSSESDPDFAMGGLQDNSTAIYLGSTTWSRYHLGGDGSWTAIDPRPPQNQTVFASAQNLAIYKSVDGGFGWSYIAPAPGEGRPTTFIAPFVIGFGDPDVMYAGRDVVYRSANGGFDWTGTNGGNPLDGNPMIAMAISKQSDDVVYVASAPLGSRAGVFRTTDSGASWTDITGALPDRFPTDLAVDPTDDTVVYITFSGFGSSHVFRSSSGGDVWDDIGAVLPDVPTTAVIVDPLDSERIFVGNDLGVYVSFDGGAGWQEFNEGITDAVAVIDLSFSSDSRLRAVTHGNGVFERASPGLSVFADGFETGDTSAWWVGGAVDASADTSTR